MGFKHLVYDKIIWILLSIIVLKAIFINGNCAGRRCGTCIVSGSDCLWCKQQDFNGTRCGVERDLQNEGCTDIVRHPTSTIERIRDEALTDGSDSVEPVQLKPQAVKIKLVPNKEFTWNFEYRVAENFPVDIYFLVDPSYTMRNLKTQLANLAQDIGDSIARLTNDYRFGYGTSMDKVTLPYTHTTPEFLQNPCPSSFDCDPPHSFRHRLPLTNNVSLFTSVVSNTKTTANRDATEGLFDGVMQVAVCGEKIGWRSKARRMLIYASDIDYHFAGDGKLAGIVKPHDLQCYLGPYQDGNLIYTHDTVLDYPSVGQIRKVMSDNNINTIFVISGTAKSYYDKLSPDIPGSFTESLTQDASNILDIIRNTYEKLRSTVKFVNDPFKDITYEYWSSCTGCNISQLYFNESELLCNESFKLSYESENTSRASQIDKRSECTNITVGRIIEFEYRMKLNIDKCSDDLSKRSDKTSIHPEGLEDRLDVDVEYICDCECQKPEFAVENSTRCNSQGRFECGVCHCNPGWSGDMCDCDISQTQEETCGQTTDGINYKICSNVGECKCGKCECPEDYTGKYCECYNKDCGYENGLLCAGNGVCKCSKCECNQGYNGTKCECPISDAGCRNNNGTICSGNGVCECGKCKCNPKYRGDQCQECPTCPGQCKSNQDCAACTGFQKGQLSTAECTQQCTHVSVADVLKVDNVTRCQFFDEDGCQIEFTYEYNEEYKLKVIVKSTRICPPGPPDPTVLALGVSGAIFVVGLLLLLVWKLLTSLLDTMEYKKFATEINDPKWGFEKNPLYKDCVTDYQNPLANLQEGETIDDVPMRKK